MYADVVPLLLSQYSIEFTHDGTDAQFLCPFHAEDTPSCRMSFESGLWFCFGCGAKGNIEQFASRVEGDDMLGFAVIRRLERKHPASEESRERFKRVREEREAFDYVSAFSRYRRIDWALIPKTHSAYRYFVVKRGISPFTLTAFDARLTGDDDYPVAIPIMRASEMMGYVKRYVGDDPEARRYLYNKGMSAKEAMAFHQLGGNGHARNGPLLVVEGMMDYLKAAQFGARDVAAILSWQIKPPQVEFLKRRGVEEIVCALDDDDVGRRGCALLTEYFRVLRFRYPGAPVKDVGDLNVNEFWMGYENAEEVGEDATVHSA